MKKIIFLLFAVQISLSAQVEKVWSVKIPDVFADSLTVSSMHSDYMTSPSGTTLVWLTRIAGKLPATYLAWITSNGDLRYLWKTDGESVPSRFALLQFNDDYIVTLESTTRSGRVWVWEIKEEKVKTSLSEFGENVWFNGMFFTPNSTGVYNAFDKDVFFGASVSPNQKDGYLEISKYRLNNKSPTFWVQQSEDLETWRDVIEVPKGETPKEFFRIAPEN